ncbi:hypothetical protein GCM10011588_58900 [Nocardia jinanensis]|uniref:Uncharacterized protein n=1 Tax=Nocardia jinanensis TaxID=382504 RepID=A0A917RWA3_9NOCA|nr:hypothetical protein GCM10011588_58900 [Nocardia jinanensis]
MPTQTGGYLREDRRGVGERHTAAQVDTTTDHDTYLHVFSGSRRKECMSADAVARAEHSATTGNGTGAPPNRTSTRGVS